MVKTRALWLLPSALADMYDDAVAFVDDVDCPRTACRLLYNRDTEKSFAVPDGAFRADADEVSLLDRNSELYDKDDDKYQKNAYDLVGLTMHGCNDEAVRTIALYKTLAYRLTEKNSEKEEDANVFGKTLEMLEAPMAGVDLYMKWLEAEKAVVDYTTGDHVTEIVDTKKLITNYHFVHPKSKKEYDELKQEHDFAKSRIYSANFDELTSGNLSKRVPDQCKTDLDNHLPDFANATPADFAFWKGLQVSLGNCKSSLEALRQEVLSLVDDPLQAPQKPLSSDPTPEAPLGSLEFFQWGQAEFSKLLDLQKCVNFVHPAPYMEKADHLLDLVTAKVAWVLPALKLENLPQIRAMLNIGFDLTEDDWAEALQKMSAADKTKQEAQYAWQKTETRKFFTALYGRWAEKQAAKPSEVRTAQQIIESYAFPKKAEKPDVVNLLPMDDQIISGY